MLFKTLAKKEFQSLVGIILESNEVIGPKRVGTRAKDGKPIHQFLPVERFEEMDLALSPDGRWLAYTSDESGRFEIYVRPFPDSKSARWQVSTNGGAEPRWSHSGRELLFAAADGTLQSVEVVPGPVFTTGRRSPLFGLFTFTGGIKSWDITPNDSQFVMIRSGIGGSEADELIVVENIFPELRKKGSP